MSDEDQTISMSMELHMSWNDPRIVIAEGAGESVAVGSETLRTFLWLPDLTVFGLVDYRVQTAVSRAESMEIVKGETG